MADKHSGGCEHHRVHTSAEPIDNHECHCNACKKVTGQHTTHVACFNHDDIKTDNEAAIKRVPFNADNPNGPLEFCLCERCNAVLMLDDKQKRNRVAVPNVMGYDDARFPKATYHAFRDASKDYAKPSDGRPGHVALQPSFAWPKGA